MIQEFTAEPVLAAAALLGEGPHWDPACSAWWWVDILGKRLHRFDGTRNETWTMPTEIGTVVPRAGGGAVVALRDRIQAFADGKLGAELARIDHPGQRFNDGKCDPRGRLWVGSLHMAGDQGKSAFYRLDHRGLVRQLDGVSISNGLCWSPDGRTLYYVDTPTGRIDGFDFDLDDGALSNRRTVATIPAALGAPDGMAIDDDGLLWLAPWDGGCVLRIDPRTGGIVAKVVVPGAKSTTACSFAGKRLLITTAGGGSRGPAMPHAGDLFLVDLPVGGPAMPAYAG